MYPKEKSKHRGSLTFCTSVYGDSIIIKDEFETLEDSPQKFELINTIFNYFEDLEDGIVYTVDCTLWFMKNLEYAKIIKISDAKPLTR